MNCLQSEERLSEYLDGALLAPEKSALEAHLASCDSCRQLHENIRHVVRWGDAFPEFSPPEWLLTRILANTPRTEQETWLDTLGGIGRWVLDTRTAMAVFTASVMLAWMLNLFEISVSPNQFRNPEAIYYSVDDFVGEAYNRAVRLYYQAPLVGEIQSRIEQLRESS